MSLIYLNANDFRNNGKYLGINIRGMTLVLFHSQKCQHCLTFLPEYKTCVNLIQGVKFGLCCVDDANRSIVQASKNSSTPITSVPKFLLYNDGMPIAEYTGARNKQNIYSFLMDIAQKFNQKQTFTAKPVSQQPQQQTPQQPQQEKQNFTLDPNTNVRVYENSYGKPYNMTDDEYILYDNAYKQ